MTAESPASRNEGQLPLAGLRVLDFGHTVMGPTCGLLFADLGAEVIRIEPPGGDRTRRLQGFGIGFFGYFNRNKKSVVVDLKHARATEVMEPLLRTSDVLIENFAPGAMDRLGLGYEQVKAINKRLVYCSLKGFLPGPYGDRPALDEVVQMLGGLAYMTGPKGRPLRAGTSVIDITGGVFGAFAILAALRERDRTGEGQLVSSGLFESTAFLMGQHMAFSAMTGVPVPPMPSRITPWAIYDVLDAADGQIFLAITSDEQWKRFCAEFGQDRLLANPAYSTNDGRLAARDELLPEIARLLASLPLSEALEKGHRAKISCAPVNRPEDLFDDPHLNHDGLVETVLPGGLQTKLPKLPIRMRSNFGLRSEPPAIGQDTASVLGSLGLGAEQIQSLVDAGVIGPEA